MTGSTINTNQITMSNITFDTLWIDTPIDGAAFIGKYLSVTISGAGSDNGVYKIPLFI
jgi:hypothetical protein